MSAPGLAIAEQLEAASLGLTLGGNLFNGPVRKNPAHGVFCLTYGGRTPEDIGGGGAVSHQWPRVQIRVREVSENFGSGETLAANVWNAIHLKVPAGYIECRAIESSPLYLGQDDLGRHEWAINVELMIKE